MSAVRSLTVSIIIPMRNEARYIQRCLDTILDNDFPDDEFEVLVVDGQSTDNSCELVLKTAEQHSCIHLLHNTKRIVPAALNLGISQARGRYIIRMDAHSEYPKDYIRTCIQELERTGASNVGGRCITKPGADTTIARAIAKLTQMRVAVGNSSFRLGEGNRYVDTVPFGAFPAEVFDRVGLFREDLVRNQDFELNARIRRSGGRIYLSDQLCVTYYNVPTFLKFMRQAYSNGLWNARGWICYPVSFCWRHAAPLVFVLAMAVTLLLVLVYPLFKWAFIMALALYFLVVVVGVATSSHHGGYHLLVLIPALTFCYHVVYGIGEIPGLLTGFILRLTGRHAERATARALPT
jgi:glycosyltransferase involved in cell wall biosynthesis